MKKVLALILILAVLVPAAALSDRDPILGCWYIFIDSGLYPEIAGNMSGYDNALSLYYFTEDGIIYILENDVKDNMSTPLFQGNGKWTKSGNEYSYSLIGIGEGKLVIKDDILEIWNPNGEAAMKLRRIVPFNPYADYVY